MRDLTDENLPKNFHGIWIDKVIWQHEKLSWLEKCVMMEIDWLCKEGLSNGKEGCWASNKYLAKLFDVHINTMSRIISKLREEGLLEFHSFDGRSRILKSLIVTSYKPKQ